MIQLIANVRVIDKVQVHVTSNETHTALSCGIRPNANLGKAQDYKKMVVRIINSIFSERNANRFSGFKIFISNTSAIDETDLCYANDPDTKPPPTTFETSCLETGQYVVIYNNHVNTDTDRYPFLELCEVEVYGTCLSNVFSI